ncbi:MAG: Ig-like domain-containing protein, partial [Isosphaeraceae bacterium]
TPNSGPGFITTDPDGNIWFTEPTAIDQAVVPAATRTQLSAAPNPSAFGEAVSFTAIVAPQTGTGTPTGTVTFSIDGVAQPPVALAVVGGTDQASFSTSTLTLGQHTVTAVYNAQGNFTGSPSNAVTQVVTVGTSPVTITSLKVEKVKIGTKRHAPKAWVLFVQFSGALGTTAAENVAAYTDFSGKIKKVHKVSQIIYNKFVPLTQAIYNSSGDSVILVPKGKQKLSRFEQLQVNVSLLTDPLGRPINNGKNFSATVG